MAVPLGMFSTIGVKATTLVFTPRSCRPDIAAITAAAPDMSVFIVSMPDAVFSESPPESNTTPLPTSATFPLAPGGEYVIFTRRGDWFEPCPTPSTPPSLAFFSAATSSTSTFTFLPRRSVWAARANAAGDFSPDGVFTRSRAHMTAAPTAAPRSSAASTLAPPRPSTTTRRSFDGFASDLYSRYW
jgi:hypothetical protein